MQSENQRAMEAALAAYERAYSIASSAPPSAGGSGAVPELHEALDAAHATALQAAFAEFRQQVRRLSRERPGGGPPCEMVELNIIPSSILTLI